ncbi:MAG: DUF4271 domain-containing protein [Bacteroidales bacterium]|nr:DUF4271 domain-containing protein [Bacteroidales bacterium]
MLESKEINLQDSTGHFSAYSDTVFVDTGKAVIEKPENIAGNISDSSGTNYEAVVKQIKTDTVAKYKIQKQIKVVSHAESDTTELNIKQDKKTEEFQRFNFSGHNNEFSYKPRKIYKETAEHIIKNVGEINFIPHHYQRLQFNWTLIIGFLSVSILLSLKALYNKFIIQVINTLVNYQLADKLFREKNIVIRRAFFLLNINFQIVFSLFILLILKYFAVSITKSSWTDYLIINVAVFVVLITRIVFLYILGYIFESIKVVSEYLHNTFLINKNLGLILLPLLFITIYTSSNISKIALIIALVVVILATVFKIIRGFQIIVKNGFLLFYSFLYLCTLELLPLVIGSKLITLLR